MYLEGHCRQASPLLTLGTKAAILSSAACIHPDSKQAGHTFIGHLGTGLQVHFGVSLRPHSVDLVTQIVAAVLPAAEAETLLKGFLCVATVCHAGLFFIEEGVNEEVDGPFMGAFHQLIHIFKEQICIICTYTRI